MAHSTPAWFIEGTFGLKEYKNGTKGIQLEGPDFQQLSEK
jgi:hypothetical protein